jgi:hypothetical protein
MAAPRKPAMPAALDTEKSVLGAILLISKIPKEVTEDLFFNPDTAHIFRLMQGQSSRGLGVDLVSMIPAAQKELDHDAFMAFIALPGLVPSVDALPFWVKQLQQKREERRLHLWARQVGEAIAAGDYEKLLVLQGRERQGHGVIEGQPRVQINDREAQAVIEECWEIFQRQPVPVLFQQGGRLVRCSDVNHGRVICEVSPMTLRAMLGRSACFVRVYDRKDRRVEEHAGPAPTWVSEGMTSLPRQDLPILESVVATPFFAPDGRLVTEPGYHADGRCWLEEHGCEVVSMGVEAAKEVLRDWLVDFCFEERFDYTNAVALILLPFVRRMVSGPTPGHLIEASTPGSGKGLLAKILFLPFLNAPPDATPFAEAEEERRKSLMAALVAGRPVTLLDNLKGKVDSPVLEGILTSDVWRDRLLGVTGTVYAANKTTWVFTGNNADLSLDMARRCLRIRLDQRVERPYEASREYAHPDIEEWTRDNRGRIISAVVSLVQHWIEVGRPKPDKLLGSFEGWSRVVGGILQAAGYPGWLEGRESMIQNADRQGDQLKHFVEVWTERALRSGNSLRTAELVGLAEDHGLLSGTLGDGSERSKQTRLGAFLARARGRVFSVTVDNDRYNCRIPEQQRDRNGSYWVLDMPRV